VHHLLKTGFDPEFRRWAPGLMLRLDMIDRAVEAGLRRYDLAGTDEPWKADWSTATATRLTIRSYPPTPRGRAAWAADARFRPLVRRLPAPLKRLGRAVLSS
jgi:CelD/BcsL family acetyltransferase involved in cellulose biosynthesis